MDNSGKIKYWSIPAGELIKELIASENGLSESEADMRLKQYGPNRFKKDENTVPIKLFLMQFKSPIVLIMITATIISALTGDWIDSAIILAIVLASIILSFFQEYNASNAVEELQSKIQINTSVIRNGEITEIPTYKIVPGDIVYLSAGSLIPADGLILSCDSFHVNQSALTGEAFAVEKNTNPVLEDTDISARKNCVFMGTNVRSGKAKVLVVKTGESTEFGQIAEKLTQRAPETEFGRGVRRFGYLLTAIILIITVVIFSLNVLLHKPLIDSLLFSVAIAIGITPQLLPAIINITLSRGSQAMAKEGVIVRRLSSMENFGSIDILCTDKTGTMTVGAASLEGAYDFQGEPSDEVFKLAYLNAVLQTGIVNEIDSIISKDRQLDISSISKVGEVPFDFERKRMSVVVNESEETVLIVKGAMNSILKICDKVMIRKKENKLTGSMTDDIQKRMQIWSEQGFRIIGVAKKQAEPKDRYTIQDEQTLTFMGFLLFMDPLKPDVIQTISELSDLGIKLRIITGDNKLTALHIAKEIGLNINNVLTGSELLKTDKNLLADIVEKTEVFAEVDPDQKEQIILTLKKGNHVVGYMGDGINDAPALHAADISISVNSAVDVAKESADFVLREKNLTVLKKGIELGRATFANTMKYINITISANFGNMFSMAGASLFLPFLPLLPKQILLINFISDFPAMTISSDSVDPEMIKTPKRWDIKAIRNFMIIFGLISSVFDYLSFTVLILIFHSKEEAFQSGWFVLSILTELLALLIMRTHKPFYRSRPSPYLFYSVIAVGILAVIFPYLPMNNIFGIAPINPLLLIALIGIAFLYIIITEIAKYFFFRQKHRI